LREGEERLAGRRSTKVVGCYSSPVNNTSKVELWPEPQPFWLLNLQAKRMKEIQEVRQATEKRRFEKQVAREKKEWLERKERERNMPTWGGVKLTDVQLLRAGVRRDVERELLNRLRQFLPAQLVSAIAAEMGWVVESDPVDDTFEWVKIVPDKPQRMALSFSEPVVEPIELKPLPRKFRDAE
jgi:hypothetical protein